MIARRSTLKGSVLVTPTARIRRTCTLATPALASRFAGTVAVSALELPKFVDSDVDSRDLRSRQKARTRKRQRETR